MPFVGSHDCEHVNVYVNDLIQGERVVVTEKDSWYSIYSCS
jgi:hypothetical protein